MLSHIRSLLGGRRVEKAPENDQAPSKDTSDAAGAEVAGPAGSDVAEGDAAPPVAGRTRAEASSRDGDEQYSQAERIIRDAVALYRARGYVGTITISHKVGIFTETCSLSVRSDAIPPASKEGGTASKVEDSRAGRAFETLLARLERRAMSWDTMGSHAVGSEEDADPMEGIDPVLGASASLGFAMPVIKVGWGLTISLSITKSTLYAAAPPARRVASPSHDAPPAPRLLPATHPRTMRHAAAAGCAGRGATSQRRAWRRWQRTIRRARTVRRSRRAPKPSSSRSNSISRGAREGGEGADSGRTGGGRCRRNGRGSCLEMPSDGAEATTPHRRSISRR